VNQKAEAAENRTWVSFAFYLSNQFSPQSTTPVSQHQIWRSWNSTTDACKWTLHEGLYFFIDAEKSQQKVF